MRPRSLILSFLLLPLFIGGCAREPALVPAPEANIVPGRGLGALEREGGVQIEARVDAWRARPANLSEELTPILVMIDNQSSHPLLVRYAQFKLVKPNGTQLAAIPPFNLEGEVVQAIPRPPFAITGFYVAPYLSRYYPYFSPVAGSFFYDPFYYSAYYPTFRRIPLPTGEMVQLALPEGVLEPQGSMGGFLYFEKLGEQTARVDFTAQLIDARTNQRFGTVTIPFVMSEEYAPVSRVDRR